MQKILSLFLIGLILTACGKKEDQNNGNDTAETDDPLQVLYNQVMDIHDEVMPKMEDLYNAKKDLQEKITNAPDMVVEERERLEHRIAHIDSVSNMMMDWMHNFNPLPDTADQEQSRAYLESEMEKIKKVRDAMLETIEKEKGN